MFEKICVQPLQSGDAENPLDLGFLAEAMLFYDTVEITANRAILQQLVREFRPKVLLKFLRRGYLRIRFEQNFEGIVTEKAGTRFEHHSPTVAQIDGEDILGVLEPLLATSTSWFGNRKKLATRLAEKIEDRPIDSELAARCAGDFNSASYIRRAVRRILEVYIPDVQLQPDFRFEVVPVAENQFCIDTNLDFRTLNRAYHRRISQSHSTLTPAYLLSHFITARKMLEAGALATAEIAAAPVYRVLISTKIETAFRQRDASAANIEAFQRFVIENGRSLSAIIAARERSFHDLLKILKRAKKFRRWLHAQSPDEELVQAYFREVTKGSWIDKLPAKTARWSLFTGIGLGIDAVGAHGIGTAIGVSLSAADAFLLDKLVKGWKPNQFVDKALQNFVRRDIR